MGSFLEVVAVQMERLEWLIVLWRDLYTVLFVIFLSSLAVPIVSLFVDIVGIHCSLDEYHFHLKFWQILFLLS